MNMSLDYMFSLANQLAVVAWACLLAGLSAQGLMHRWVRALYFSKWALFIGGRLIPVVLAVFYGILVWWWFGSAQGGFSSLIEVERLFETRGMLLAGWLHYLAFDLWIGRWAVDNLEQKLNRDGRPSEAWIWRLAATPCLLMIFLFGPIGLVLYLILAGLHEVTRDTPMSRNVGNRGTP